MTPPHSTSLTGPSTAVLRPPITRLTMPRRPSSFASWSAEANSSVIASPIRPAVDETASSVLYSRQPLSPRRRLFSWPEVNEDTFRCRSCKYRVYVLAFAWHQVGGRRTQSAERFRYAVGHRRPRAE